MFRNTILFFAIGAAAFAGAIHSGTISSTIGGSVAGNASAYAINIDGVSNAGLPFQIDLSRVYQNWVLGHEICDYGGCTWDFNTFNTATTSPFHMSSGSSILWDGVTYALDGSSPYIASFTFSAVANSVTVSPDSQSSITPNFYDHYTFPSAPAAITLGVTIKQGTTTLVSETLTANTNYTGSARRPPVGSESLSTITYSTVPEPSSWLISATGLLGALACGLCRRHRRRIMSKCPNTESPS